MKKKSKIKYLTTQMIAEKMGFTQAYIRKLCSDGKIKSIRLGHDWMICENDFDEWKMKREKEKITDESGSE